MLCLGCNNQMGNGDQLIEHVLEHNQTRKIGHWIEISCGICAQDTIVFH